MKKLLSILMLLVAIVTGAKADPVQIFDLTGSSTTIANKKTASIGGAYVGRDGSTLTPSADYGIPTGGGKTAAVFVVNATATITIVLDNQQTSAKSGTINLASVTDDYYTACTNGTLGSMPSSAAQECAVSWVKNEAKGEKEYSFSSSVTAGKYIVYWTSGINGSIYLKRIEINAASSKTATTTTITGKSALNLDLKNGTSAGTLAATVVDAESTAVEGATVSWSSSDESVATINASTGAVTLKATGTTTLKATYAGNETYDGSNNTYQITVTDTRTALTASWDNAAPVFTIDEAATNPIFTVTGGEAELDTDYEVAYTKVSGDDLATIGATGGITAINTSAAGTETIKATVTVINGDYKIATTEYNCVITVASTNTLTYNANGGSGEMDNTVGYGSITLSANKYTKSGYTFMGWATSQAAATAGTVAYADEAAYTLNEDATIYAVWAVTDIYLVPATSGDAPASGDDINMQSSSFGGSMKALSANLSYTANGLQFGTNSSTKASVTLDRNLKAGSVIIMKLVSGGTSARGLHLYSSDGSKKITTIGWSSTVAQGAVKTFSYEVKSTDTDLIGSNSFQLWRNNTVILTNLSIVDAAEPVKVELNNVDGFNYGFAGFCAPKNFSVTNGTAYKAVVTDGKMVLKSLDGIVPADKGVVIAGTKGATATITYTTEEATADVTDNDLLGTTERTLTSELKGSAAKFLTLQKSTSKFIQYTGTYFPAYKAYLLLDSNTQSLDLVFDNPTAINGVAETEAKAAPVKVIKNGKLYIGNYNVAGQLVK